MAPSGVETVERRGHPVHAAWRTRHKYTNLENFKGDSTEFYYMAELVHGETEHSDWFPERSEFCYTNR